MDGFHDICVQVYMPLAHSVASMGKAKALLLSLESGAGTVGAPGMPAAKPPFSPIPFRKGSQHHGAQPAPSPAAPRPPPSRPHPERSHSSSITGRWHSGPWARPRVIQRLELMSCETRAMASGVNFQDPLWLICSH